MKMDTNNIESSKDMNKATLYSIVIIVCVTILPYLNTFHSPFTFDDIANISKNHWLQINDISAENLFQAASNGPSKNRPLPNMSFAFNYYFGGLNVWGYHLINLIVHLSVSVTLFFLIRLTLRTPQMAEKCKRPREIALFAVLLWAIHPLQTNAVTYLVQRMTSMATLFFLLSLFLFAKGWLTEEKQKYQFFYFAASCISAIFAFLCKENTAILPFILFAYFLFFLKPSGQRLDYKKYILIISSALIIPFLALVYLGKNPLTKILSGYATRDFTLTERLLTESRILFHYITLIILPLPSRLNLNYDYTISHSVFAPPQTLLAIIGIGLLLYAIHYFYQRDRLTSFAIFWFLANLVIESTIIPLELVYEHRLYLPSTFVILCVVYWIYKIPANNVKLTRGIIISAIILFSFFTWQRNTVWKSNISLWTDIVAKSPAFSRGYGNLGHVLNIEGRYSKAEEMLLKAIELDPDNGPAYFNLAITYNKQNRFNDAHLFNQKALTLNHAASYPKIYHNMGKNLLQLNDIDGAIEALSKAVELNPYFADSYIHLGYAYGMKGLHQKAEEFFLKSIALEPANGHTYLQLATSYEFQKKYSEALMILEKGRAKTNSGHSQFDARINRIKTILLLDQ